MKTNDGLEPVEVFSGKIWEAELVKSLLENAEIEVFLNDEITGTMVPWIASPGGAGPVTVVVSKKDYDKAKSVVAEYEKNIQENI